MAFSRYNNVDQMLDVDGSATPAQNLVIGDEPLGLGAIITGQTGIGGSIGTVVAGVVDFTGGTGFTQNSVGDWITISGAASGANNGTFLIITYVSATEVMYANASAVASDTNNPNIAWQERYAYSLQDDMNYRRTEEVLIKGTTNWYDPLPTYQQPNAIGTNVSTNLTTINGHTTDAVAYTVNRAFFGETVLPTDTFVTVTSVGNLKHADNVNRLGVPVFDTGPFINDWNACYVHIVDGYATGSELTVLAGPHIGERIFGETYNGASTSPDSVEIHFYSAPFNVNYAVTSTPYTWEVGQPEIINLLYGYNERLDLLDENAFRTVPALGILTDAQLAGDISNILEQIGTTSGDTSLFGLLTNTTADYPFSLLSATPSVVNALNVLNQQFGNQIYTGPYLTSGQTVTASLQALSNSISNSTVTRYIERLSSPIPANTSHLLPGGATYVLDGTENGQFLWVFVRGLLNDPGSVVNGDDYAETDTTHVTFYQKVKPHDHINYFVK